MKDLGEPSIRATGEAVAASPQRELDPMHRDQLARAALERFSAGSFEDTLRLVELLAAAGHTSPSLALAAAISESELGRDARAVALAASAARAVAHLDPEDARARSFTAALESAAAFLPGGGRARAARSAMRSAAMLRMPKLLTSEPGGAQ